MQNVLCIIIDHRHVWIASDILSMYPMIQHLCTIYHWQATHAYGRDKKAFVSCAYLWYVCIPIQKKTERATLQSLSHKIVTLPHYKCLFNYSRPQHSCMLAHNVNNDSHLISMTNLWLFMAIDLPTLVIRNKLEPPSWQHENNTDISVLFINRSILTQMIF